MNDYFSIVDEFSFEEFDSSSGESSDGYSSFSFDAYGDTSGTQGNDYMENYDDDVMVEAYGGNDTVNNYGSYVTINGGAGNDQITNINDGDEYTASFVMINGGSGDDSITNGDESNAGGSNATINGDADNDFISNTGENALINGGDGNDYVSNAGNNVTINGGAGNDEILSEANKVTINGNAGDDHITIDSTASNISIDAGADNDTIENYGTNITINGGAGNDYVYNYSSNVTIDGGVGDDYIDNDGGSNVSISGNAGNDYISNNASNVTISGDAGKDTIDNVNGSNVSISGGAGNDGIYNNGKNVTINGGAGSDTISFSSSSTDNLIEYTDGDGNDLIQGFNLDSTLQVLSGYYSMSTSGDDIIVTVGNGRLTLEGAKSLSTINIISGEISTVPSWSIYGTTATYGTEKETLITVEGVSSTIGLSEPNGNNVVTVSKSALGTSSVTISDGYTLRLASDVSAPKKGSGSWAYSGTTAKYNQTTTAGYTLASDAKSIVYSKKTTDALVTVEGVTSKDGLSFNGNAIVVSSSSLGTDKVTVSDGYTLSLGSDVTTPTTTKAAWSLSKTTATYNSASTTAGYTLASDAKSISYSDEEAATALVTVTGVTSLDGLSLRKKVVTVSAASLGTKNVTISDGYTLKLGSDVTVPTTNDAEWKFDGTTAIYMGESSSTGYTLADNTITYSKATTATALASIEGAKAVDGLTVSGKTIKTTATALSSNVSVGSDDYGFEFVSGYKSAKITGIGGDDTIKTAGQKVTVDGGAGSDSIVSSGKYAFIEGGAGNDFISATGAGATIEGGKGNDTLTGGTGANVFVYANGDGKDVITNYNEQDKISITSGAENISTSGDDVIFTIGKGSITVKDAVSKVITYYDASGNELVYPKPEEKVEYNSAGTLASLPASYSEDSFTPTEYSDVKSTLKTIDASAVEHDLTITGNKQANKITGTGEDDKISGAAGKDTLIGGDGNDSLNGGDGNDSLSGGAGKDTLFGGKGSDIFVYNNGDGNDIIEDYSEDDGDKIQIASGTVSSITTSKKNVIFTVGKGKLTVQNASEQLITYIDSAGEEKIYTNKPAIYNEAGTSATLTANYTDDEFTPTEYADVKSTLLTIDASAVQSDLKITGNKKANNITGSTQDDFIDGAAGADVIYGGAGADTLYGNAGNDKLYGDAGNDSLSGGAGADTLEGGAGSDKLTGGDGADIFVYNNGDGADVITDYEEGVDKIQIASGSITSITPSKKNLILKVGKGQITINNAAEKEITVIDADGNESVINDRAVVYNEAGTAATLNSGYTDDEFTPTEYADVKSKLLTIDASAVKNDLKITGNKKANNITGSTQDDFIDGAAGADTIYGGAGADTLSGNAGNDKLYGEAGNDSLSGGDGADTLEGGAGSDKLTGGDGADIFVYKNGDGADVITDYSEDDGDKISIASGTVSSITTSKKNVIFTVGKGKITVQNAADQLVTYIDANGDEKVYTNKKVVYNEAGTSATLNSGYTDDAFTSTNYKAYTKTLATIDASAVQSDLTITANKLANKITGSGQDDFIDGAAGADTIYGGAGADTLYGNSGNDELYGEAGNDSLSGGAGADTLEGGAGKDTIVGGAGADLFVYNNGDGNDVIEDYSGDDGDRIQIASGSVASIVNSKNDVVFTVGKGKITLKNAINEVVTYMDSKSKESVYTGNQIVYNEGYTAVTLKANYTDDEFVPSNYKDHTGTLKTINAAAVEHDLKITGSKLANIITGSGQDDTIDGAAGADKLYGGAGNDSIFGGTGNDLLDGGKGADTLWGGAGTDTLTGGDGRDTFIYNAGEGSKTITDYSPKLDKVIVNGDVKGYAANNSGDVIFTMTDGAKLTFTDCADKAVVLQNSSGKTIENGAYYGN